MSKLGKKLIKAAQEGIALVQEEETNVVSLELITGGKGPPTTGNNWLDKLEEGTVFAIISNTDTNDFNVGIFKLVSREGKITVLSSNDIPKPLTVYSTRFCNRFALYEDLGVLYNKEQQKEEKIEEVTDDDDNRIQGE